MSFMHEADGSGEVHDPLMSLTEEGCVIGETNDMIGIDGKTNDADGE